MDLDRLPKVWIPNHKGYDSLLIIGGNTIYTIDRHDYESLDYLPTDKSKSLDIIIPQPTQEWKDWFHKIQKSISLNYYDKRVLDFCFNVESKTKPEELLNFILQRDISSEDLKQSILNKKIEQSIQPFYIDLDDKVLFGVTPEKVLTRKGNKVMVEILGGTKLKKGSWTQNKYLEHDLIVDDVLTKLTINENASDISYEERQTKYVGYAHHLQTQIFFSFDSTNDELIRLIHPTLAVKSHNQNRNYFGGLIGFESEDELHLWLNIRSGVYQNDTYNLCVGCGITSESDIDEEWKEVGKKLNWISPIFN